MSSIAEKLASLLSPDAVVAWEALDANLKAQIIQAAPDTAIECVVYPTTSEELAEVVTCAHLNRWRMLPCGSGSKLHWGGLAQEVRLVVSTARLNRLVEHASSDMTVTVEAGLPLAELQTTLATTGQFLAVDPAYASRATLGGIVATADTGALRQRYGGIRDMLIGISLVRSDGKLTKAGGRVVKNVAGYDLMKLLTGSFGTLGILSQLTFRIYPLPPASQTIVLIGATAIAKATATLLASALTPTAIEVLTPATVQALRLGNGMGLIIRFQSIDVSVAQQTEQVIKLATALGLTTTQVSPADEAGLWQQLREQIDIAPNHTAITCKIGIEPNKVVETLNQIDSLTAAIGIVHASSGLGTLKLTEASVETLLSLRRLCQTHGGFLTVLAAPLQLKQAIDVWGYPGNALEVMQRLKTQFDSENLLSPHRFVGGI